MMTMATVALALYVCTSVLGLTTLAAAHPSNNRTTSQGQVSLPGGQVCLLKIRVVDPHPHVRVGTVQTCRGDSHSTLTIERIHRQQRFAVVALDVSCDASACQRDALSLLQPCAIELKNLAAASPIIQKCVSATDDWRLRRSTFSPPLSRSRRQSSSSDGWTNSGTIFRGQMYHNMDLIEARMNALVSAYPGLVSKFVVGSSYSQQNSITGLRISTTPAINDPSKPEILLVGTHHAREWIAAEVPIGIAEALCGLYYRNKRVRRLMRRVEFIVVPVINPDGYRYSMLGSDGVHRYWRKNRHLPVDGVDLNRNYPVFYGRDDGSSSNPYDETYRGSSASSEPEVQALEALAANTSYISRLGYFVSYHNYGQDVLWPYGEAATDFSPIEALMNGIFTYMTGVVMAGCENSVVYTAYKASGLYPVSGDAVDYFHKMFNNVPSLTVELRPTDQFDLPVDQINATVLENVAPVLYYVEYALASMDLLTASGASAATVFAWWNDGTNAAWHDNRVTAMDSNGDKAWDWFGLCDAAGSSKGIIKTATLFDDVSPFALQMLGVVNATTGASLICSSQTDVPSVLGGGGYSQALALHVDPSKADPAAARLSAAFASATTCEAASTASIGAQLAAALQFALTTVSVSIVIDSLATRTLTTATGQPTRCVVRFRAAVTNGSPDLIDDLFSAALGQVLTGTFGSDPAITALLDADYDTSVPFVSTAPPPSQNSAGSTTASPSATSAALLNSSVVTNAPAYTAHVYTYLVPSSLSSAPARSASLLSMALVVSLFVVAAFA